MNVKGLGGPPFCLGRLPCLRGGAVVVRHLTRSLPVPVDACPLESGVQAAGARRVVRPEQGIAAWPLGPLDMGPRARTRARLSSIRTRVTLPFVALAVIIAAGGGYLVSQVALNSLEERFTNQLTAGRLVAGDSMVGIENELLGTLRLISHTDGLAEVVRTRSAARIAPLIFPLVFNSGEDAVLVLDRRGRPLVAFALSESTGEYDLVNTDENMSDLPFVSKVLRQQVDDLGDKYSGVASTRGTTSFFVAGPVQDETGSFLGAVLVGRSLSTIVMQLRDATLAQVTIYDLTLAPLTSSFQLAPILPHEAPEQLLAAVDGQGLYRDLQVQGANYTELVSPWRARQDDKMGAIGVALPTAALARTGGATRVNITALTILGILLAALLGISASRPIAGRISSLGRAATQVAGGDLDVKVSDSGTDEVAQLSRSFNDMVARFSRTEKNMIAAYDRTVEGWSTTLEMRDPSDAGHTTRVADMSVILARAMNFDPQMVDHLRRGALLHDIGNMAISDPILFKPGHLSDAEWVIVKQHPLFAREILYKIEFLVFAMDVPVFHHERWDGSGYPYGISGEMIPRAARVFAVVDVWDALTSARPYRAAWSAQSAFEYVSDNSGILFDPHAVRAFQGNYEQILRRKRGPDATSA